MCRVLFFSFKCALKSMVRADVNSALLYPIQGSSLDFNAATKKGAAIDIPINKTMRIFTLTLNRTNSKSQLQIISSHHRCSFRTSSYLGRNHCVRLRWRLVELITLLHRSLRLSIQTSTLLSLSSYPYGVCTIPTT